MAWMGVRAARRGLIRWRQSRRDRRVIGVGARKKLGRVRVTGRVLPVPGSSRPCVLAACRISWPRWRNSCVQLAAGHRCSLASAAEPAECSLSPLAEGGRSAPEPSSALGFSTPPYFFQRSQQAAHSRPPRCAAPHEYHCDECVSAGGRHAAVSTGPDRQTGAAAGHTGDSQFSRVAIHVKMNHREEC